MRCILCVFALSFNAAAEDGFYRLFFVEAQHVETRCHDKAAVQKNFIEQSPALPFGANTKFPPVVIVLTRYWRRNFQRFTPNSAFFWGRDIFLLRRQSLPRPRLFRKCRRHHLTPP